MKLMKYLSIPLLFLALSLNSCSKDKVKELTINNSNYSISKKEIMQTKSSFLEDGQIKIGVVSDIEGAVENAVNSADKLKKQDIDAIIIAGDCYENEQIRRNPVYPYSTDNDQEMFDDIEPYAKLGVPVFVIPGNHETKSVYNETIKKLQEKYPNVLDIKDKIADLKGVNIIGMGGYHDSRFTASGGFLLSDTDYKKATENLTEMQKQKELDIFVTHGPPKSKTIIDYVEGAGHVGDEEISKIMNENLEKMINVHGHIHEGGNNSCKYKCGTAINVASINGLNNPNAPTTALIFVKDNGITYEFLR